MQKHVNLVDLVKSFPTNIYLQNLASIRKRTNLVKFAHLAEKSGKGSISNLSTKAWNACRVVDDAGDPENSDADSVSDPQDSQTQDAAVDCQNYEVSLDEFFGWYCGLRSWLKFNRLLRAVHRTVRTHVTFFAKSSFFDCI